MCALVINVKNIIFQNHGIFLLITNTKKYGETSINKKMKKKLKFDRNMKYK